MDKITSTLTNENPINEDLYVCECGYEHCNPQKPIESVIIDYNVIHYCNSGEGFLNINNQKYHIKPGDLFIIPAHTAHSYQPSTKNPWFYHWVGLKGKMVDDYLTMINLNKDHPVIKNHLDYNIANLFEQIYIDFQKNFRIKTLASTFYLLHYIEHNVNDVRTDTIDHKQILFNECVEYINNHYQQKLSIDEMAKAMSIDRSYLFKLFKQFTNASPSNYIQKIRLEKASLLLINTELSITDIAFKVGFKSGSYFSELFNKYYLMSPKEYRNMEKKRKSKHN